MVRTWVGLWLAGCRRKCLRQRAAEIWQWLEPEDLSEASLQVSSPVFQEADGITWSEETDKKEELQAFLRMQI